MIERRRGVCGGAPRVAGTRIRTEILWSLWDSGCTLATIQANYPALELAEIMAAIDYEDRWYRQFRRALIAARLRLVRWAWERWGDE